MHGHLGWDAGAAANADAHQYNRVYAGDVKELGQRRGISSGPCACGLDRAENAVAGVAETGKDVGGIVEAIVDGAGDDAHVLVGG